VGALLIIIGLKLAHEGLYAGCISHYRDGSISYILNMLRSVIFLIVCICFLPASYFAQNLLDNPSFESGLNQWLTVKTVDHYPQGTQIDNFVGPQTAYNGTAFIGIRTYSYYDEWHEYIYQNLDDTLVAGETYKISLMLNLAECSSSFTNDIGVAFIDQNLPNGITDPTIDIHTTTPQVYFPQDDLIQDVDLWIEFSGYYESLGNEVLVAIGSFKDDDEMDLIPYNHPDYGSKAMIYLNIDQVELKRCVDYPKREIENQVICTGDTVLVDACYEGATYQWSTGAQTSSIEIRNAPGSYWVTLAKNGCQFTDYFTVENFMPVDLPDDILFCTEEHPMVALNIPSGKNDTFLWDNGSTLPSREITEQGTYWLIKEAGDCSSIDSIRISTFELAGISYPNPTRAGEVYILDDQDISNFTLIDDLGKRLGTYEYNDMLLQEATIHLASGMYFLILEGKNCMNRIKLVIQN